MYDLIKNGATSYILRIVLRDSTTGVAKTGLTYASSGLIVGTIASGESSSTAYTSSNLEDITTIGTYAAPTSGKCRFKAVDGTNHPGLYEIHLADARYAVSGAKTLTVSVGGVSGVLWCHSVISLKAIDMQDTVRMGLTALPNAAAEASGGLVTRGTGTGQISVSSGQVILQTGTGTGQLDFTSGVVKANTTQIAGTAQTAKDLGAINVTNLNTLSGHDPGATLGTSTLTQSQVTGGAYALNSASFAFNAALDLTTTQKASVNTEVDTAIADANLDDVATDWADGGRLDLILDATAGASALQDANDNLGLVIAVTNKLDDTLEDDAGTYRFTTNALAQAPTGGSAPTAAAIADAVWDESTSGHTTSGTFGEQLKTDVDAILVDTAEIGAAGAGLTATATAVWAVGTRVLTAGTNIALAKGTGVTGFNDLSAAQVNAEVVDVLRTDTATELSAVPAASPNLHAMVQYVYMAERNKIDVTASAREVHNDAGTVIGTKTLSDDGSTYSESKAS